MIDDAVIESFRMKREECRERRAANREASPQLLREAGIAFTVHSHGVHLIVDKRYDFWPGTGKWKPRSGGAGGRGVRNLIARIRALANERGSA
ncbi:MAG TPA: hypothetical protein VFB54_12045 [Burkholderiales bacterium]|nr:hypothetical protein [Burkholderiales bacterium]